MCVVQAESNCRPFIPVPQLSYTPFFNILWMARQSNTLTEGHQIIIFFMFSVFVVGFLLLTQINLDLEFRATLTFFIILIGSFVAIFLVSFSSIFEKKLGENSARLFFLQDISIIKFVFLVPIGVFASLGVAIFSNSIGLSQFNASILSISGSGVVMMILFLVSKSVMPSVIVHGIFNVLVLALRDGIFGGFKTAELFPVPELALTTGQVNSFGITILQQFTMVAFAEEMLKMCVIAFVVLSIPKAKFKSGISKYIGVVLALVIWTSYHLIQAIKP